MNLVVTGREMDRIQTLGSRSGNVINPAIFMKDSISGREYAIIAANRDGVKHSVLMRRGDYDNTLPTIFIHANGYPYLAVDSSNRTHHSIVVKRRGDVIPEGHNIDHINWKKNDNRSENLRVVPYSEQNVNRTERKDKRPPPEEFVSLGILSLPRRMRWDVTEQKFVVDLPTGNLSGTKSQGVTVVNRFRDCCKKLMSHLNQTMSSMEYGKDEEPWIKDRIRMAEEYNQLVRAAHAAEPDVFVLDHVDTSDMMGNYEYVRYCLERLPPLGEGEKERGDVSVSKRLVDIPEIDAIAIVKGDTFVLFDRVHADVVHRLPELDCSSFSFFISPQLRDVFPRFDFGKLTSSKKILAKDLMWYVVMGKPVVEGHCVVPLDGEQCDVREENLTLLPGTSKNYKSTNVVPVPRRFSDHVGSRFWPKGVVLSNPSGSKMSKSPLFFNVKVSDKQIRPTCSDDTVVKVYAEKVLPFLVNEIPNFETVNSKYQKLLGQYVDYREIHRSIRCLDWSRRT
jgi:hypothetical protein